MIFLHLRTYIEELIAYVYPARTLSMIEKYIKRLFCINKTRMEEKNAYLHPMSSSDRLCLMLLERLEKVETSYTKFQDDFIQYKRVTKHHEIMKYVEEFLRKHYEKPSELFVHYDSSIIDKRNGIFNDEDGQLAMSICVSQLSNERILDIWKAVLPYHNINAFIKAWDDDTFDDQCLSRFDYDFILKGVEHDSADEGRKLDLLNCEFTYEKQEIRKVLNQMTLLEIADIVPKIHSITYSSI